MTKNPFINASAGILYIILVASVMFYGTEHAKPGNSVIVPIAVLSLFSLSAALMGYFFLYQPVQLYLDGKKKEATTLFVRTILVFAGITMLVFVLLLSGVFK
jgi:heme/copper-type cytochrome/quinol oxidase subunit 1